MSIIPKPEYHNQRWSDINEYTPNIKCHICQGESEVKTGRVSVTGCAITHRVNSGFSLFWRLCKDCYDKGWMVPNEAFFSRLEYININTFDVKTV